MADMTAQMPDLLVVASSSAAAAPQQRVGGQVQTLVKKTLVQQAGWVGEAESPAVPPVGQTDADTARSQNGILPEAGEPGEATEAACPPPWAVRVVSQASMLEQILAMDRSETHVEQIMEPTASVQPREMSNLIVTAPANVDSATGTSGNLKVNPPNALKTKSRWEGVKHHPSHTSVPAQRWLAKYAAEFDVTPTCMRVDPYTAVPLPAHRTKREREPTTMATKSELMSRWQSRLQEGVAMHQREEQRQQQVAPAEAPKQKRQTRRQPTFKKCSKCFEPKRTCSCFIVPIKLRGFNEERIQLLVMKFKELTKEGNQRRDSELNNEFGLPKGTRLARVLQVYLNKDFLD